jgi:DNA-binding SARP family transcriptional activator/tetratricopeptide (TPR) repeat protein
MLNLRLLGSFELASTGGAAAPSLLAQPKRAALLAYLAIAEPRGFQRRDRLVALFWPEADTTRARRALNQALHYLRERLEPGVIVTRAGEEVGLDPERLHCDVLVVRDALARGDLDAAVGSYRGPLLPGFHVQAGNDWDDWLEEQRRSLHTAVATAARTLAERAEKNRHLDVSLHWSRRACELAPNDESCAQQLIRVLMRQGNEAAARVEVQRLRERLRRELDAEPSARTTALLKSQDDVAAADARAATPRPDQLSPAVQLARISTARPRPPVRRRRLIATTFLLVLGVAAALGLADRSRRATEAVIAPAFRRPAGPVLLVADFDGPPRDTALGAIVTQLFLNGLQESRRIRVVWSGELAPAMQRMMRPPETALHGGLARELALREGFGAVLDGSVREIGGRLLVNAALVSPSDGRILWTGVGDARDARALTSAIQSEVRSVRHVIGDPARQIAAAPPLAQVVTPSLEALRAYTEALHARAPHTRAVDLLERAIALDTGFAAAYRSLGSTLSFTAQQERASALLWKAVQHADRLNDYSKQLTTAVLYSRGRYYDPDRALAAFDELLARDSTNMGALRNAAWLLVGMGQLERAEALDDRALAVDSNAAPLYGTLAGIRFMRGHAADGMRTLDAGIRRTGYANLLVLRARARLLSGQFESIDPDLRRAIDASAVEDRPLVEAMVASTRASLARSLGHLEEAHRFDAERIHAARARGNEDEVVRARLAHVEELTWLLGDRAAALAELAQLQRLTLSIAGVDRPVPAVASALADAGKPSAAAALMRAYEREIAPGEWRGTEPGRHAAWGRIALANGRAMDAVREFRKAAAGGCEGCVLFDLAVAYVQAGLPDSAIAVGERFLGSMNLEMVTPRALHGSDMHRRLAALYLHRGDTVPAVQHLTDVVTRWRDADGALHPAVRAACRDLARVRKQVAAHSVCAAMPNITSSHE